MKITLTRYHQSATLTRSRFTAQLDTDPTARLVCEAREPGNQVPSIGQWTHIPHPIPTGVHRCAITTSDVSPMTVKVCQRRGTYRTIIGFDPIRQWRANMIILGQADPTEPPEERTLDRQQETFNAFTALVYRAFAHGETISIDVTEAFC